MKVLRILKALVFLHPENTETAIRPKSPKYGFFPSVVHLKHLFLTKKTVKKTVKKTIKKTVGKHLGFTFIWFLHDTKRSEKEAKNHRKKPSRNNRKKCPIKSGTKKPRTRPAAQLTTCTPSPLSRNTLRAPTSP